MNPNIEKIDAARRACGFLTIAETLDLLKDNLLIDPFSTLISSGISVGQNNIFYPGVTLQATQGMQIVLGNNNTFHSGTSMSASEGNVTVGNGNQFGDGGFTAKANRSGAEIRIGDCGRFLNNPSIFGQTTLGDGTQLLGNIIVDSCILGDGGSFEEPDPDLRGGLLKGFGTARNLTVPRGNVIAGQGHFDETNLLPQSHFHPKD
ncbi:MAG: AraC family transcriptional regulator [Roseibium sp.]|uniref:AraC family transcriptional regulator n=1 Tax=Roseibium sp. TaxID=1936156 RepID=UPI002630D47E|nr:AraC family transcriptional regulator [Roseibium sp.]MCV0424256.1 AraC family transcriptional regulator [Roseibium sp.]